MTTKFCQEEPSHAPKIPEFAEVIRETLVRAPSDDISEGDSEPVADTALTSFSPTNQYDFPRFNFKPVELSQVLQSLQLEDEEHVNEPPRELSWLNLAISDRQEKLWPDIPYTEPEDWEPRTPHKPVATKGILDGLQAIVASPTIEQGVPPSVVKLEREEIDVTAAFSGMGATDLDDDFEEPEVTVEVSKADSVDIGAIEVDVGTLSTVNTIEVDATEINASNSEESQIIELSPETLKLIDDLEKDRQALFTNVRKELLQQKPQLQKYVLVDVVAGASEKFGKLEDRFQDAIHWALAVGSVTYTSLHEAHTQYVNNGDYQRPKLEESERPCGWDSASKAYEAEPLYCPVPHLTEQSATQLKDNDVLVHSTLHHESYLGQPIKHKTSTSPEISLWVTLFASRKNAPFPPFTREGVLASQATKFVDPYQYTGPQHLLDKFTGTKLQNEIAGYVNRIYTGEGSWQYWHYEHHEGVPKRHSDVEDYTSFEDGCDGMQLPHYIVPKDCKWNDIVCNGDCGFLGPPIGAFRGRAIFKTCVCGAIEKGTQCICKFYQKANPLIFGSPLRNEVSSASNSEGDETEVLPFVARLPSIAEEEEEPELEPKPAVVHLPSMAEEIDDGPAKPVEGSPIMIPTENSSAKQFADAKLCGILDGFSEEAIDQENDEFYGALASNKENSSLARCEESEDFNVEGTSLPAHKDPELNPMTVEDADHVKFDEDPDYTDSWTKQVRRSSDLTAAHLAKLSEDSVEDLPARPENPMAAQLAKWSDEEDARDQDFEGDLEFSEHDLADPEDVSEVLEHESMDREERSEPEYVEVNDDENIAQAPTSSEFEPSKDSPSGTGKQGEHDYTAEAANGGHDSSSQDNAASSWSSDGDSSPPNKDESTLTTPDHNLNIDQEIAQVQARINQLLRIKYEREYPTLEDFGKFGGTEERIPLFPIVENKQPRAAKVLTGILTMATRQDPELDKYIQNLTDAMASKDLRVKPELVQAPTPEPKPKLESVILVEAVDAEDSEALVPNAFSIVHPSMLFESEVAKLAEVRKAEEAAEAAEAAQVAEALRITDAAMQAAALAGELQDLEDNAAVNGGHVFFEPVNAGVPFEADEASPFVTAEISIADEELEEALIYSLIPEGAVEVVPVLSYGYHSDTLELQSAPDFNEHLYGTIDFGIAKSVKKLARKLKFWGKVQSGKLDLVA